MAGLFDNINFLDEEDFKDEEKQLDEDLDFLLDEAFGDSCPYITPNEAIKITNNKDIEIEDDDDSPLDESFSILGEDILNEGSKRKRISNKAFMSFTNGLDGWSSDETSNIEEDMEFTFDSNINLNEEDEDEDECCIEEVIDDDDLAEDSSLDESFYDLGIF